MAINTLVTIKDALEAFVDGHDQIQRIEFEADDHRAPKITEGDTFPCMFVAPVSVNLGRAMNVHRLKIYIYEKINDDRSAIIEDANDTSLMLRDIRVWWNAFNSSSDINIINDPDAEFLCDRELDNLVGYFGFFDFEIPSHGRCDVPVNVTPVPPAVCADANYTVKYENGTIIDQGTIPSGGSVTVEVPDIPTCDSATWILEDSNGTQISTGTIPSGGSATIVAPDADISLNGESFPSIPSGGSDNIEVIQSTGNTQVGSKQGQYFRIADSTITINTNEVTENVNAEGSKNFNLFDQNNDPVGIDSVSGDDVTLDIVPGSIGAKLLKTGQTTSYRTGDDGDLQKGRAVDFLTLDGNNPFGNTNRFTDELGGQTYTNQIAIDWSTYNGSTVLGYNYNLSGNLNWDSAIDNPLSRVVAGFSNWYLPNKREIENILNSGVANVLNYSPFNFGSFQALWSSTTVPDSSGTQAYLFYTDGRVLTQGKTATAGKAIAVREFTVTGTTLT